MHYTEHYLVHLIMADVRDFVTSVPSLLDESQRLQHSYRPSALATVAARLQHAADVLGKSIHTSIAHRH